MDQGLKYLFKRSAVFNSFREISQIISFMYRTYRL